MPGQDDDFAVEQPLGSSAYAHLARPFDSTHHDTRGGINLEYITGEQCITRLNQVLGPFGWSGRVVEHGYNADAEEMWALYELTIYGDELGQLLAQPVVRQQFGSQKVKRSRQSGTPLDIGFDLKGATTDALKKCATLIGVALYLSSKEAPAEEDGQPAQRQAQQPARQSAPQRSQAARTAPAPQPTPITAAPSAQTPAKAPMPARALNLGQPAKLTGDDWNKFYTACMEHLGLETVSAVLDAFPGNIVDAGQLLHAYNTNLQGLYLLLQWIKQGNAAPPYLNPIQPMQEADAPAKPTRRGGRNA